MLYKLPYSLLNTVFLINYTINLLAAMNICQNNAWEILNCFQDFNIHTNDKKTLLTA